MKKLYLPVLLAFLHVVSFGQITVTSTNSPGNTNYTRLKAAFDAINAGTFTGAVTITVSGTTNEPNVMQLNASGSGAASYTSVTITASAAATIGANKSGALITLNGADYVTILGNNLLTISNTSAAGNVISFVGDATHNRIFNTTLTGSTTSVNSGVVYFGAGITTGNDDNTLDGCTINGSASAAFAIQSNGTVTSSATENSADTIRNSNILNFRQSTGNAAGIFLNYGSTDWVLSGNSIYQTTAATSSVAGNYYGVLALPAFPTDAHMISGNYIGGSAATATGTMTITGTGAAHLVGFMGIDIETGGTNNTVMNNTVRNVALTFTFNDSSIQNAGIFAYNLGFNGSTSITGNVISDITVTNTAGLASVQGIAATAEAGTAGVSINPSFTISNNTISNLTGASAGAGNINITGIRLNSTSSDGLNNTATVAATFTVNNNTISNLSAPISNNNTWVRGISSMNSQGTGSAVNITPAYSITSNTISGLTSSSITATYAQGAVEGIKLDGSNVNSATVQTVSQNMISGLSATQAGDFATTVLGINVNNGIYQITRNRIYDLNNLAVPVLAHPGVVGVLIRNSQATSLIANNFISLGAGVTTNVHVFGIMNSITTQAINVYYNSVVISGTGTGMLASAAFNRGTENFSAVTTPMDIKNNIFMNTRTGIADQYAVAFPGGGGYTSNYNDIYSATTNTTALYMANAHTFATYQALSGQDANSLNIIAQFADIATADLHLAGASVTNLKAGTPVSVTIDYDAEIRDAVMPYIGADEITAPLPLTLLNFNGQRDRAVNLLSWTTGQERNTNVFEVQRSNDGINFTTIGTVKAAGNSNANRTYHYTDAKPLNNSNYYRLRIVDLDNAAQLSKVIKLGGNAATVSFSIYPNPVQNEMTVNIELPTSGKAEIMIVNMNGQLVQRRVDNVVAGNNNITLQLSQLGRGNYVIKVRVNDVDVAVKKFDKL